jgi:hypothetical protein
MKLAGGCKCPKHFKWSRPHLKVFGEVFGKSSHTIFPERETGQETRGHFYILQPRVFSVAA